MGATKAEMLEKLQKEAEENNKVARAAGFDDYAEYAAYLEDKGLGWIVLRNQCKKQGKIKKRGNGL
jgi:hypothetical protein